MVTVNEILSKMGSANYISLFDSKSSCWQIRFAECKGYICQGDVNPYTPS